MQLTVIDEVPVIYYVANWFIDFKAIMELLHAFNCLQSDFKLAISSFLMSNWLLLNLMHSHWYFSIKENCKQY